MILICPLEIAAKNGIKMVELNEIYKTADYITVHIPKTDETTHMIARDPNSFNEKNSEAHQLRQRRYHR